MSDGFNSRPHQASGKRKAQFVSLESGYLPTKRKRQTKRKRAPSNQTIFRQLILRKIAIIILPEHYSKVLSDVIT